ncbi:hypothetical protein PULV_a1889 [Pseudoalteromonas ulvae UL12]|nr:hypothetical protein [Pseudoalteromonas ulvae UL12]
MKRFKSKDINLIWLFGFKFHTIDGTLLYAFPADKNAFSRQSLQ